MNSPTSDLSTYPNELDSSYGSVHSEEQEIGHENIALYQTYLQNLQLSNILKSNLVNFVSISNSESSLEYTYMTDLIEYLRLLLIRADPKHSALIQNFTIVDVILGATRYLKYLDDSLSAYYNFY